MAAAIRSASGVAAYLSAAADAGAAAAAGVGIAVVGAELIWYLATSEDIERMSVYEYELLSMTGPVYATKPKPKDCPTGTKPIDEYPGLSRDDIHRIKRALGAGPTDWVGITPNGDVITDENGQGTNQGPLKSYLP